MQPSFGTRSLAVTVHPSPIYKIVSLNTTDWLEFCRSLAQQNVRKQKQRVRKHAHEIRRRVRQELLHGRKLSLKRQRVRVMFGAAGQLQTSRLNGIQRGWSFDDGRLNLTADTIVLVAVSHVRQHL